MNTHASPVPPPKRIGELTGVLLPAASGHWDVTLSQSSDKITGICRAHEEAQGSSTSWSTKGLLVLPSLCHPHIHLDKPHLLTHPSTSDLRPTTGSFTEALSLTANAKQLYSHETVRERMQTLLADSSRAGVTHMRGFAEVDATVHMMALDTALDIKREWASCMHVQVCAFAQDPVFSGTNGPTNRALMEQAVVREGVEVLGSTPYVEEDVSRARENVEWAVRTAMGARLHLDLHLDYNVDENTVPLIWWVLEVLRRNEWAQIMPGRTVCLGHCTRLTLFGEAEWTRLHQAIKDLPVYFVGLPTSDLFMMGRPPEFESSNEDTAALAALQDRKRCTLQVPAMIRRGFDACLGVNNVGNAFTPYGAADPLNLAQWGIGIYQAGTIEKAEVLFDCVSRRAKEAIGVGAEHGDGAQHREPGQVMTGDSGDLLLIGRPYGSEHWAYRRRTAVCEVVWDAGADRQTIFKGNWVQL